MSGIDGKKLQYAYKQTFSGISGETVLEDLSKRCREFEDGWSPDERQSCYHQGRRSVILEIRKQLKQEEKE